MSNIGERITHYRNERGLSRSQLASEVRVTEAAVGHMENNQRKPSLKTAVRLANFFGVSLDELIGTDESIFDEDKITA
jgi:putative transcriptional regulator